MAQLLPTLSRCYSLLTQGEICFAPSGHSHGLGLVLGALMPGCHRVAAIGCIFDLVISAIVGLCKIFSWDYKD